MSETGILRLFAKIYIGRQPGLMVVSLRILGKCVSFLAVALVVAQQIVGV